MTSLPPEAQIDEPMEVMLADTDSASRSVLSLLNSRHGHDWKQNLSVVLLAYSRNDCADCRDKIFGLQSLLIPEERVPVDYSQSMRDILKTCLQIMIPQTLADWSADALELHLSYFISLMDELLGCNDMEPLIRTTSWSFLVHDYCPRPTGGAESRDTEGIAPQRERSLKPIDAEKMILIRKEWRTEEAAYSETRLYLLHITRSAVTTKQRELTAVLEAMIPSENLPWHRSWVFRGFMARQNSQVNLQSLSPEGLFRDLGGNLEKAGAELGFAVFGRFMCHPEDWIWQDEKRFESHG